MWVGLVFTEWLFFQEGLEHVGKHAVGPLGDAGKAT